MTIGRVTWRIVRVPFVHPFASATGMLDERAAVVLSIDADGMTGFGEATPWPAFEQGDVDEAARDLAAVAPRLVGLSLDEARVALAAATLLPSARCAVDCALFDLAAKARGITLASLLGATRTDVAINAVIGAIDPSAVAAQARAAVAAGVTTVKLKVGTDSLDADLARVRAVRAVDASVAIRLDANGAWNRDGAIAALKAFEPFSIAYVEQPVAVDDLVGFARVRDASGIPIAADESLRDASSARALIGAVDVFILKLTTLGGIETARAVAAIGAEVGIASVVTTSMEFGFGIAASFALAASLPPIACGLATGELLRDDLVTDAAAIADGSMHGSAGAGLGVEPDVAAIERYAVTTATIA